VMNSMSDKCFVDTNVLVYAHDRSTGKKHERARELLEKLWDSGNAALSTQVLQELCFTLQRKAASPLAVDELRRLVRDYLAWEIVANGPESVVEALDVQARYKISFWNALILQAAEIAGATVLYSEDFAAGQHYGSVQVVNPFVG
jgi:predicted nucleic acid-binding protein